VSNSISTVLLQYALSLRDAYMDVGDRAKHGALAERARVTVL
jgi:hypothetical protein